MRIKMLDLQREHSPYIEELHEAQRRVLESGRYIGGEEVEAFEEEVARYTGLKYVVACSSGTDALIMALMALGVGRFSTVVTTPVTFFATTEAILRVGAYPVFCDIEPDTLLLDMDVADNVYGLVCADAMIGVSLFGRPMSCAGSPWTHYAGTFIDDAAQSFGAPRMQTGLTTFSFHPTKVLGGFGDGGAVATCDVQQRDVLRQIRCHGSTRKNYHERIGGNFRLDAMQAALLRRKLRHATEAIRARQWAANLYMTRLPRDMVRPSTPTDVYGQFVVMTDRRDDLRRYLATRGIESQIHYDTPIHQQPCMSERRSISLPNAESACERMLALPVAPHLTREEIEEVADEVLTWRLANG